jgi:hypothetical protein
VASTGRVNHQSPKTAPARIIAKRTVATRTVVRI